MKKETITHNCRLHKSGAIDQPCEKQCVDCGVKQLQEQQDKVVSEVDINSVNAYTCGNCAQNTVIKHRDKGVAPFFIDCVHCGKDAISHMYKVPQDLKHDLVAFKPNRKREWELYMNYLMQYYDDNNMQYHSIDTILKSLKQHVNNGGVLLIPADKLKNN